MNTTATPVKGISWTDLVVGIEPKGWRDFPANKASTIRPLISGRIKLMHPEREYTTETLEEVLRVTRVK